MAENLVRCYGNLYAAARVDALDALDNLPPLKDADELKSKILFSVVVVSRFDVTPPPHFFARFFWILLFSFHPGWLAYVDVDFFLCFCEFHFTLLSSTALSFY